MGTKTPSSEKVKELFDEFRRRAPEEARRAARETGEAATEAWRTYWRPWDGINSPAGRLAVAGGVLLFTTGWLLGRNVKVSPRSALLLTAAVAGGVASGVIIGRRLGAGRSAPSEEEPAA